MYIDNGALVEIGFDNSAIISVRENEDVRQMVVDRSKNSFMSTVAAWQTRVAIHVHWHHVQHTYIGAFNIVYMIRIYQYIDHRL
jgi:hypothetical protein